MTECIVAYTGEGQRYWPLIEKSIDVANSRSARLILYNVDSASKFANPLPTRWSADGGEEQVPAVLSPEDLEKAGQGELKRHVENARGRGVDAYGWLASERGAETFSEYAAEQGATLLIVPSSLEEGGFANWMAGQPSGEDIAESTHQPILRVEIELESANA